MTRLSFEGFYRTMQAKDRQTVFISHANPADNDAAGWLASKLSVLGYRVWVDIEKLKGGESLWRTIEPVLRFQARCLILIVSRSTFGNDGLLRQGVANEMELALTLERDHPRFVLPWILDDLPFSNLPIQLQNRMSVPEPRWSAALPKIVEYLDSLGIVASPKSNVGADLLQRLLISEKIGLSEVSAIYDINRLECLHLPESIFSVEDDPLLSDDQTTSTAYHGRRLSFHALEGSSQLFGKGQPRAIGLQIALENGIESLRLSPREVKSVVVELVKKSLHTHLRSKGLAERSRINRSPIYFFNSGMASDAKIAVKLPENSKRSTRKVWGNHKDIYWHLGIEVIVSIPEGLVVTLVPHILFTSDSIEEPLDEDPTKDRRKQHNRRRAIAKLWFNDKWRGFFYPFLAFVSDTNGSIPIPFNGNSPLVLAGKLSTLTVPVTHVTVSDLLPDDFVEPAEEEDGDG